MLITSLNKKNEFERHGFQHLTQMNNKEFKNTFIAGCREISRRYAQLETTYQFIN